MDSSPGSDRQTNWIVGFGLLVLAIIAVFVSIPRVTPPISEARQRSCENNLRQLNTLAALYSGQFGGPRNMFPSETGKAFWLKLTQTTPPLVDASELEVLLCPESAASPAPGFTTYSGPARDVNTMKAEEIIGCCRHGHPDGMIFLTKDGSISRLKGPEADKLANQLKE